VAVGSGVWPRHGTVRSRGLHHARGREAALPSRGQPAVERSARVRMRLRKLAVYLAYQTDCKPCALREQCLAKGGKRRSGASRQRRPPSLASACRCGAQAHRAWIDALGRCGRSSTSPHLDDPTFVGNTLRSFPWFRPSRRPGLLLVHPVPCVRITAGEGMIGSPAMPGSDHRTCVSQSLVFLIFWRGTNQGGTGHHRSSFNTVFSPSECIRRAKNPCRLAALSLSSPKALCRCAEVPLRIKARYVMKSHLEPLHLTSSCTYPALLGH
jgi:hypothetical protein